VQTHHVSGIGTVQVGANQSGAGARLAERQRDVDGHRCLAHATLAARDRDDGHLS